VKGNTAPMISWIFHGWWFNHGKMVIYLGKMMILWELTRENGDLTLGKWWFHIGFFVDVWGIYMGMVIYGGDYVSWIFRGEK
jgi:hypothetical protein